MKFLIQSNGKINDVNILKNRDGSICEVAIDFTPPSLFSDLEFWLNTDDGEFIDYGKMCISRRNKMQFYKK